MPENLSEKIVSAFKAFDTCTLADALETFDIRLRNHGYARPGLKGMTQCAELTVGFASTARIRSSDPPMRGRAYDGQTTWWPEIDQAPLPRIAVIQDIDPHPGAGACVSQISAAIFKALHCAGVITNGAVRDVPAIARMGLPLFASYVTPSHSYAHLIDSSQPVDICGLHIRPGDLLAVDCHGVLTIPEEVVAELPRVAAEIAERKRKFIAFCQSADFSLDRLTDEVRQIRP